MKQPFLVRNWIRTMQRLGIPCNVGVCEFDAIGPDETFCHLFTADKCAKNPRVGRWYYIQELLQQNTSVFNMDSDTALLRSPLQYIGQLIRLHPHANIFTSSDANVGKYVHSESMKSNGGRGGQGYFHSVIPGKTVAPLQTRMEAAYALPGNGFVNREELRHKTDPFNATLLLSTLKAGGYDLGLEEPSTCSPFQYNTGMALWIHGPRSDALMRLWIAELDKIRHLPVADDQVLMNDVMKNGSLYCTKTTSGKEACGGDGLLNTVANGAGCLGILPIVQWSNGAVYSLIREHEQYGVLPFEFHATYSSNKISKLREEGLFIDESGYYEGRFLFYTNDFKLPVTFTYESNYALVQHQLKQLRGALALARASQRILILPEIVGICENFFFPGKDCVILGHRWKAPMIMPLDHWLVGKFPHVQTREPGFLRNVRFNKGSIEEIGHAAIASSAKTVHVKNPDAYHDGVEMFDDEPLGAWCCVMRNTTSMKVLYSFTKQLELVENAFMPHKKPGA